MSYMESRTFIMPNRDTHNSNPYEIEFTATSDGVVIIQVDDRHLTFDLSDLKKMIAVANAMMDELS